MRSEGREGYHCVPQFAPSPSLPLRKRWPGILDSKSDPRTWVFISFFFYNFLSGPSEIGFGDNMPIRGDHEPDARMPRVGVRAVHFAEGGGSHVHSEGGGACRARERERDNGDANFDLWAIVSDYGTRRAERERR